MIDKILIKVNIKRSISNNEDIESLFLNPLVFLLGAKAKGIGVYDKSQLSENSCHCVQLISGIFKILFKFSR